MAVGLLDDAGLDVHSGKFFNKQGDAVRSSANLVENGGRERLAVADVQRQLFDLGRAETVQAESVQKRAGFPGRREIGAKDANHQAATV